MNLRSFLSLSGQTLDAALTSFSPRAGASSREIRKNGALCTALGFVCFLLALLVMFFANSPQLMGVILLPVMLGYSFVIVGGYRLVFGANLKAETPYDTSLVRIFFGVAWIVLLFGVPLGLLILFGA